jgi:hypothetical protein
MPWKARAGIFPARAPDVVILDLVLGSTSSLVEELRHKQVLFLTGDAIGIRPVSPMFRQCRRSVDHRDRQGRQQAQTAIDPIGPWLDRGLPSIWPATRGRVVR